MNTGDLLLRAVLCDPGDDTVRLAFADYLEENGRGLHARFVRDQIAGVVRMVPLSMLVPLEPLTGVMSHQTTRHATARGCVVTCDRVELVYRRGFVDEVRLPAAAFTEDFARKLFARHPVTRVVLTDREPTTWLHGGWTWISTATRWQVNNRNRRAFLRPELMEHLPAPWPCATADEAVAALSDACVAWGRSLAGLPPLPHASGGA